MSHVDLVAATIDLVQNINDLHGTRFSLVGRLPGGFQEGTYGLRSPDGHAALKWNRHPMSAERLNQTARVVAVARAAGWPTPQWLYWGLTPAGIRYVVMDYVDGHHREDLDEETLNLLLKVNSIQSGLDLPTGQDWSGYAYDVVFNNRYDFFERVTRFSSEGERFRAVAEDLCAPAATVAMPTDDLVCGVFFLENILFTDSSVAGVIDVLFTGRGCLVFDLAVLYSRLSRPPAASAVEIRLRREAQRIAGPEVFAVCLVAEILGVLAYGLQHWPDDVPQATGRWAKQLEHVRSGSGL